MKPFRTPQANADAAALGMVAGRGFNSIMDPDATDRLTKSGVAKDGLGGLSITQLGLVRALSGDLQ